MVAARLSEGEAGRTWWILLVLVGLGVLVGLINGVVTTRLRVPSFITTLGMLLILQGAVFLWTGGAPTGELAENLREFGRGRIDDFPVITSLPYAVLILVAVGAIGLYLLGAADFGRRLFAAGGNARAAALSGVNVANVRTAAFVVSALSAVVAGVLLAGIGGISAQVGIGLRVRGYSRRRAGRRGPRWRARLGARRDGRRADAGDAVHVDQLPRRARGTRGRCAGRDHHRGRRFRVPARKGRLRML